MLARLRERGQGVACDTADAARLYRIAIERAPLEAYAMAPFLALHWLRLRLLLAPLLAPLAPLARALGAVLPAPAPEAAVAGSAQPFQQRSPALPSQWDTLLIAAMVGVLTWVLWRKHQLQQRAGPRMGAGQRADAHLSPVRPSASDEAAAATPSTPPAESPERRLRSAATAAAAAAAERRHTPSPARLSADAMVTAGLPHRPAATAEKQGDESALPDQAAGPSRLQRLHAFVVMLVCLACLLFKRQRDPTCM